jgi:hypothetical protein
MGTLRNLILTVDAKVAVISASTCGLTSLLGATIFFFLWNWVGWYDTEQSLFTRIITSGVFSLVGGIIASVIGIKIRITNEKLRRGICGAIAGMFSMVAVERILPTSMFPIFWGTGSQFFTLVMGTIAGACAGSFSAAYIGKLHWAEPGVSAAESCALASFIWLVMVGLMNPNHFNNISASICSGGIIAIIGGVIGGILGGLLGWFGSLIGYAGNRRLSSLVGFTCGAALSTVITILFVAGMLAQ